MEQVGAQTEKIASYETSRTRRSIVDGNMLGGDLNNDEEEYASTGFYVREKNERKAEESQSIAEANSDTDNKENGKSDAVLNGAETKVDQENDPLLEPEIESELNKSEIEPENDVSEISENVVPEENGEKSPQQSDENDTDSIESIKPSNKENDVEMNSEKEDCNDSAKSPIKENSMENVCDTNTVDDQKSPIITNQNEENQDKEERHEEEQNIGNPNSPSNDAIKHTEENQTDQAKEEQNNENSNLPSEETDERKSSDSTETPIENSPEETSKDRESSVGQPNEADSKKKEAMEPEKAIEEKSNDNNDVSSSSANEVTEDVSDSVDKEGENNVSSTSNVEVPQAADKENISDKVEVDLTLDDDDNKSTHQTNDGKQQKDTSILKEQLQKSTSEEVPEQDSEMDDDFDPSLLCPDIYMDVDDSTVMTNTGQTQDDGNISPLPYEPIFSTLVDEITGAEVQIDLTPEEMELRRKMYGPDNLVQNTKVHCTACNVHLGSALSGANNRFVHPLLKVLICKNCYHFYTSGEFEKDEDGSELYCRWCGQGGQVLCCSSCEFVFCKRCIRNNFGQKKFKQIRDSDDWNCFRCNPGQLSNLRASCAEFMEYYRTELARAHSLAETQPELMTTDYTKCCSTPPEKKEEPKVPVNPKLRRKRKDDEDDPDYRPILDDGEPPAKKLVPPGGIPVTSPASMRTIVPKPIIVTAPNTIRPVGTSGLKTQASSNQVFRVGNTTFRAKAPNSSGFVLQKSTITQARTSPGYITIPSSSVGKSTTPGYIKILPNSRLQTTGGRPSSSFAVASNSGKTTLVGSRPGLSLPTMKHDWFEKTVRAAARVNSNLSYTLTQLNRQQSQANSVETLAVVHNKLQEVLSTSINSLIQIRKNLRTEFIAGIKNIKFPAKPAPVPVTTAPIVVKDDDDVIFVNPVSTPASLPPPALALSPTVTLTRRKSDTNSTSKQNSNLNSNSVSISSPQPSTSGVKPAVTKSIPDKATPTPGPIKGGFLKVRSLTALQTVPSECITIPDDPPTSSHTLEDPLKLPEEPIRILDTSDEPIIIDETPDIGFKKIHLKAPPASTFNDAMVHNVTELPSPEVKKMMGAVVRVERSAEIERILRSRGGKQENRTKQGHIVNGRID